MDFLLVFVVEDYYQIKRLQELKSEIQIAKSLNRTDEVEKYEKEQKDLLGKGLPKINSYQRSERIAYALGSDEYEMVYKVLYKKLCAETHNSSNSMLFSHLEEVDKQFFPKKGTHISMAEIDLYLKQVGKSINMMSGFMHQMYKTGKYEIFSNSMPKSIRLG